MRAIQRILCTILLYYHVCFAQQSSIMQQLKNQLNVASWTGSECTWNGITCDSNGYVNTFSATNDIIQRPSDVTPALETLSQLSNVTSIFFDGVVVSGPLPTTTLQKFSNLQQLRMINGSISGTL
ncbi:putative Receptor protein kinase CLAVATA1 precursor, partial [Planoprotostelium fungivorum]